MQHQREAVNKLSPSRVGALFMEMGTGKSRTSMELANIRANKIDKVVWFTPVSLKLSVAQEIRKHTDCEDIYVFDNKTNQHNLPKVRWYVVGIESMSSSNRVVSAVNKLITERTMVVLDESSYIKGHNSKRTERLTFICSRAKYRLILTGTPLSQGVEDLFAQMRFLSPKILGYNSFYSFAANHLEYSDKYPDKVVRAHNVEWLAAKINPYVYQVRKQDCIDLPPKWYSTKWCYLTDEQCYWYSWLKDEFLMNVDPEYWDSHLLFKLFNGLQQVVSGFYHQRKGRKKWELHEFENNRPDLLADIVSEIPNEQVIIWAKFMYDLEQIKKVLQDQGLSYVLYTGQQNEKQKEVAKQKFQSGDAQFFVATPSSGGHGLTLNEASTVIFYNNSFKYSERIQAEDRCHRIGQDKKVHYIDIVCADTIDERIMSAINSKEDTLHSFQREIDAIQGDKEKIKEFIRRL
ncbi:MAG TPA: DEAD/DEAH box helicase [Syntrophomonadaceae bacterium]|nr:DEAD/DEAH box helicase [Syntrophomonadaceae bacterium]